MPPVKKFTTEEIREMQVSAALDEAVKISEEYEKLIARRKANRTELRSLVDLGVVSDEDKELIADMYPARVKSDDDEAAATTEPAAEPAAA